MINLITPEERKELLGDYRRRRLVIAGYLFFLLLIVGLVLSTALYFSTNYRRLALEKVFLAESGQLVKKDQEINRQQVTDINQKLLMFRNFSQINSRPAFTSIIRHLIVAKTSEIKITSIDYMPKADNTARLNLRGISSSRKALVTYLDKLRTDPLFAAVESPVSNLISGVSNNFNLSLLVASTFTSSASSTK